MEWRIYLKYKNKSYRCFKLKQTKDDLLIIPKNALYFPREVISDLEFGDEIHVCANSLSERVDHYTVHSNSGERHIRLNKEAPPQDREIGIKLSKINKAIPLLTMVLSANRASLEEPKKGRWFGYNLPSGSDYLIADLVAFPKDRSIHLSQSYKITNNKKSKESYDNKEIEMRNCKIFLQVRSTNYSTANMDCNVLFQQARGRSIVITRVINGQVIAQVSNVVTG
jgi:hypothetical protein